MGRSADEPGSIRGIRLFGVARASRSPLISRPRLPAHLKHLPLDHHLDDVREHAITALPRLARPLMFVSMFAPRFPPTRPQNPYASSTRTATRRAMPAPS